MLVVGSSWADATTRTMHQFRHGIIVVAVKESSYAIQLPLEALHITKHAYLHSMAVAQINIRIELLHRNFSVSMMLQGCRCFMAYGTHHAAERIDRQHACIEHIHSSRACSLATVSSGSRLRPKKNTRGRSREPAAHETHRLLRPCRVSSGTAQRAAAQPAAWPALPAEPTRACKY
jgi:hypothetical protein